MARAVKLKVYRTAIGFHDAYIAAASQKAALEAWGSEKDLFARGAAELVTDPALTEAPLASPGKVVRRLRGTADEQMAALPPDKPKKRLDRRGVERRQPAQLPTQKSKPLPPPPSRSALDGAEAALEKLTAREREAVTRLDRRAADLASERKRTMAELARAKERLVRARDAEAVRYDRAIERWRSD